MVVSNNELCGLPDNNCQLRHESRLRICSVRHVLLPSFYNRIRQTLVVITRIAIISFHITSIEPNHRYIEVHKSFVDTVAILLVSLILNLV